ncbi:unnamed protein product [Eruca vesicaria subsp. sativa]|uniref:Uncharacterized protein n=1 Tax=Eruca vesicaria subsp. sativa TaxID=29727 RepID=A0ABC8L673_ERUVS|nr:unnamed protein product [Eruca vesicaria subsp. sativa]
MMTRSSPFLRTIQSTNISQKANNLLLIASQKSAVSLKDYKKNENKKVAVNDFLPSKSAHESIQYSM